MTPRALLVAALLGAACSSSADPADPGAPCPEFAGDPAQPMEVEIVVLDAGKNVVPLSDGMRVPLVVPPQGGKVIFAGVRARNLYTCRVQVTGYLRDGEGGRIVGLERRPIDMKLASDGWAYAAEPVQLSSYANIPVCPNLVSSRDLYDEPYPLEVDVVDAAERKGSRMVMVTPYCSEAEYEGQCLCECSQGYRLGECAAPPQP